MSYRKLEASSSTKFIRSVFSDDSCLNWLEFHRWWEREKWLIIRWRELQRPVAVVNSERALFYRRRPPAMARSRKKQSAVGLISVARVLRPFGTLQVGRGPNSGDALIISPRRAASARFDRVIVTTIVISPKWKPVWKTVPFLPPAYPTGQI